MSIEQDALLGQQLQKLRDDIVADLLHSAIDPTWAKQAALIREHPNVDEHPSSYIIPYFKMSGEILQNYYRVKHLSNQTTNSVPIRKYSAPPGMGNHLYFPPNFLHNFHQTRKQLQAVGKPPIIIITEGEKKALSASQPYIALPTIGFSGIDSWRTSTWLISDSYDVKQYETADGFKGLYLSPKQQQQQQQDPSRAPALVEAALDRTAPELSQDLMQLLKQHPFTQIYLLFDKEPQNKYETHTNIARAEFDFAYFLSTKSNHNTVVYRTMFPNMGTAAEAEGELTQKVGLDDYIVQLLTAAKTQTHVPEAQGSNNPIADALGVCRNAILDLLQNSESTFKPTPLNLQTWLHNQLNSSKHTRDDYLKMVRAILNTLDNQGTRFYNRFQTDEYYYFHAKPPTTKPDEKPAKLLYDVQLASTQLRDHRSTAFGQLLARTFGFNSTDHALISRFADMFASTDLIPVTPRRCSYVSTQYHTLYVQIGDSRVAKISPTGISLEDNGIDGELFTRGLTEAVDEKLLGEYLLHNDACIQVNPANPLYHPQKDVLKRMMSPNSPNWFDVLRETTLQALDPLTHEETLILIGTLFYLSPWFRHYNDLMLPIEIVVAEPGSGKTFLYNLRRGILNGKIESGASLSSDLRSWYSSVGNQSDLALYDNTGQLPQPIRQQLSDELCRLVTSSMPYIETRALYTTADTYRINADCCFAFTAIQNPFVAEDLLQRSLVLKFAGIPRGENDGEWVKRHLTRAETAEPHGKDDYSRERWLAHLFAVSHRFLRLSKEKWNPYYRSSHRLVGFEQSLLLMGEALNPYIAKLLKEDILPKLSQITSTSIEEQSPVLQALKDFADQNQNLSSSSTMFQAQDIINWIQSYAFAEYGHVPMLNNVLSLGRYMTNHAQDVEFATGITKSPYKKNNRVMYSLESVKGTDEKR